MRMVFEGGRATEVNIRTFIPQALAPKDIYTEMPFNLRIDGTYYGLLSFFEPPGARTAHCQCFGSFIGSPAGGRHGSVQDSCRRNGGGELRVDNLLQPVSDSGPAGTNEKEIGQDEDHGQRQASAQTHGPGGECAFHAWWALSAWRQEQGGPDSRWPPRRLRPTR